MEQMPLEGTGQLMISLIYDYGKVDSSVREIVEQAAIEIKLRERRAAEDTIAIGEYLIQVKELLPHGQFGEWIETEFGYGAFYARQLMNVARRFGDKKLLSSVLSSTAMRLLASPSVSDKVIDAVIEQTQSMGHPLQVKEVKQMIDDYRAQNPDGSYEWTTSEQERADQVRQGKTVLANLSQDFALLNWAYSEGLLVRIDRTTEWGNPFVVDEDGTREECVLKYETYYLMKTSLWPKLSSLRGKVLACWCYPEDCHGHVLINFLNFDSQNPHEAYGFGFPIGEPEDFERFQTIQRGWLFSMREMAYGPQAIDID